MANRFIAALIAVSAVAASASVFAAPPAQLRTTTHQREKRAGLLTHLVMHVEKKPTPSDERKKRVEKAAARGEALAMRLRGGFSAVITSRSSRRSARRQETVKKTSHTIEVGTCAATAADAMPTDSVQEGVWASPSGQRRRCRVHPQAQAGTDDESKRHGRSRSRLRGVFEALWHHLGALCRLVQRRLRPLSMQVVSSAHVLYGTFSILGAMLRS